MARHMECSPDDLEKAVNSADTFAANYCIKQKIAQGAAAIQTMFKDAASDIAGGLVSIFALVYDEEIYNYDL